jgi:hypothetical protein
MPEAIQAGLNPVKRNHKSSTARARSVTSPTIYKAPIAGEEPRDNRQEDAILEKEAQWQRD